MKRRTGFTLIELLVVIAVIALLMGILMPALGLAREQGKKTVCAAHSRQLAMCFRLYAEDNNGYLHQASNHGLWDDAWQQPVIVKEYEWDSRYAYWGIPYKRYTANKDIFHCPSQKRVDDWPEDGWGYPYQGYFQYCSYGINTYVTWYKKDRNDGTEKARDFNLFRDVKRPDEMILFQDHIEQNLDDNGDMFYIPANATRNLEQWVNTWRKDEFPEAVDECFRHVGRSVTAWADGHVSEIRKTTGEDVPRYWYTGTRESAI